MSESTLVECHIYIVGKSLVAAQLSDKRTNEKRQMSQHIQFWYLALSRLACAKSHSRQSNRCSHTQNADVNEDSDQTVDPLTGCIGQHTVYQRLLRTICDTFKSLKESNSGLIIIF